MITRVISLVPLADLRDLVFTHHRIDRKSVVQPARVVKPDQGAAHAFALRGRPVDLPRRLVRPAAVAFSPRVPATSTKIGAAHVRPGARANVNPACEVVPRR